MFSYGKKNHAVWISRGGYIALFNLSDEARAVRCPEDQVTVLGGKPFRGSLLRELWTGEQTVCSGAQLECTIPAHGVKLFRYG